MTSILKPPPPRPYLHRTFIPASFTSSSVILSSPLYRVRFCALRTGPDGVGRIGCHESYGADLLRKPSILPAKDSGGIHDDEEEEEEEEEEEGSEGKRKRGEWVDWEDKILEDTVPLVGFVRMILHSGLYRSGDRLSPEHEKKIIERLLPYHPELVTILTL
ncbi:hypothetical protein PTKIN_Ptkin09bG0137500 [Pterospermum kingtungense]